MRVRLGDVCKRIYAGGDVPKGRFSYEKSEKFNIPIYANAEKNDGLYGYTDKARENEISITVAARGTIGFTAIRTEPFLPVVRLITVVPNLEMISPKYLYYVLQNIEPRSSGTSIPQLTVPSIKKYSFNLCLLEEQENITKKLDNMCNLICLMKKEIELLDDLIKARFVEMFGDYDLIKLSDIADIVMGQSPDSTSYNDHGNGIPFFQGKADFGEKYTVVKHWTNKPSKLASKGDILMSVRAPVGPVNISSVDCCIGRGLCSIKAYQDVTNNEFLYYTLKTIESEISSMGTGSTFKAITKKDVYSLMIPNVPFVLQEQFSDFVKEVDKSKFI